MQGISQINFNGKFNYSKLKSKQAKKLNEIIKTEYDGISTEKLLEKMPFDVDVYCLNPTKNAIYPRFNFWITHGKKQATLQGCIKLTSKDFVEENILKLRDFINNFDNKLKSLRGDEKLTKAEELRRQVDFILFGRWF